MASLVSRGDRANRKFYLTWRETTGGNQLTRLLVGVKTERHAQQIKAQFETARLAGKQGSHILFELGVGERPGDFVEYVVSGGKLVEVPAPRPLLLMGPLLDEWAATLTNHNVYSDRLLLKNHVHEFYRLVPVKEAEDVSHILAFLDWLKGRQIGSQTQRHCLGLVSRFFAWAIPRKFASVNPVRNVPQGKRPQASGKTMAPWLEDSLDLEQLRSHLPEPLAIMFYLGNRSGIRPGEGAGLRMEDFRWLDRGVIRVQHSYAKVLKEDKRGVGKAKFVPAPDDAETTIRPWLLRRVREGAKPNDLVFPMSSVESVRAARQPLSPSLDPKTKAGFVRLQPIDTPAAEIVARATAAGLVLTVDHVWVIRNQDRRRAEGKTKRGGDRLGRPRQSAWEGFKKEYLDAMWNRFREGTGHKLTLYQATRHSFVSSKLAADVPIDEVSTALGHSSTTVTKRFYDHFIRQRFSDQIRAKNKKPEPPAPISATPEKPKAPND